MPLTRWEEIWEQSKLIEILAKSVMKENPQTVIKLRMKMILKANNEIKDAIQLVIGQSE